VTLKPTVAELGIDLAAQVWQRSGHGEGAIEVAFARTQDRSDPSTPSDPSPPSASSDHSEWVLMRVAGDPVQRVLVFDRHEWECFLDGARNGEFDAAAAPNH
jgi:hypothetical protein